jgi:uncharacterized protein YndB with AHSA1/START domain
MTEAQGEQKRLVIEKQIEIAAPVEAVWKAITDGGELSRWFPLEARVEPWKGGKISLSWGTDWEGTAPIEVWEPNRRFRWMETVSGQPVAIEFTRESRGSKTVVRIVQSSFASGAAWEDEYFRSTNYGWGFMLFNLRHYLERHAGHARGVVWPRLKVAMAREMIYERLVGPGGIFVEGAKDLRAGQRYSLRAASGEAWTGRVEFVAPPRGFCVTVESLKDALLWPTIEGSAGTFEAQLWFSTYGLPQERVSGIEQQWAGELKRILT